MTGLEAARIFRRLYTKTDSTSLSDADLVDLFNLAVAEISPKAEEIDEGFFSRPQRTDLVAGQRLYTLPIEMMNKLEKISILLPGYTDYKDVEEVRLTMTDWPLDEVSILGQYNDNNPRCLLRRNAIILLTGSTIPAVVDGLELWAKVYPGPITTQMIASNIDLSTSPSSTTVGVPRALHPIMLLKASILWKENQPRPVPLTQQEQNYEAKLREAIGTMANQNMDRDIVPIMYGFTEDGGFGGGGSFSPFV